MAWVLYYPNAACSATLFGIILFSSNDRIYGAKSGGLKVRNSLKYKAKGYGFESLRSELAPVISGWRGSSRGQDFSASLGKAFTQRCTDMDGIQPLHSSQATHATWPAPIYSESVGLSGDDLA